MSELMWYSFLASEKSYLSCMVWTEAKSFCIHFCGFRRKFGELLMKSRQKTFLGYLSTLTFEKRMATKPHGSDSIQRMLRIKLFKQSCTLQLLKMNFTLALHHCLRLQNKFWLPKDPAEQIMSTWWILLKQCAILVQRLKMIISFSWKPLSRVVYQKLPSVE